MSDLLDNPNPLFGLRILQPNDDPSLPPKRILNYKDGSELVYIPGGEFEMGGNWVEQDSPKHRVYLDGYYMAVYPVTNKQYRRFMRETGHRAPQYSAVWQSGKNLKPEYVEHPVVNVSWEDAVVYARWANLRLPTEAEWERAACGPDNFKFPWGNQFDGTRCNWFGTGAGDDILNCGPTWLRSPETGPVTAYPEGVSGYGCHQMLGNIGEWCADWYSAGYYGLAPRENPPGPPGGDLRVYRGSGARRGIPPHNYNNRWAPEMPPPEGGDWTDYNFWADWRYYQPRINVRDRDFASPSWVDSGIGFRLARSFP